MMQKQDQAIETNNQFQEEEVLVSKVEKPPESTEMPKEAKESHESPYKGYISSRIEKFREKAKERMEIDVKSHKEELKLAKNLATKAKLESLKNLTKNLKEQGGIGKFFAPLVLAFGTIFILGKHLLGKAESFFTEIFEGKPKSPEKKTKKNEEKASSHKEIEGGQEKAIKSKESLDSSSEIFNFGALAEKYGVSKENLKKISDLEIEEILNANEEKLKEIFPDAEERKKIKPLIDKLKGSFLLSQVKKVGGLKVKEALIIIESTFADKEKLKEKIQNFQNLSEKGKDKLMKIIVLSKDISRKAFKVLYGSMGEAIESSKDLTLSISEWISKKPEEFQNLSFKFLKFHAKKKFKKIGRLVLCFTMGMNIKAIESAFDGIPEDASQLKFFQRLFLFYVKKHARIPQKEEKALKKMILEVVEDVELFEKDSSSEKKVQIFFNKIEVRIKTLKNKKISTAFEIFYGKTRKILSFGTFGAAKLILPEREIVQKPAKEVKQLSKVAEKALFENKEITLARKAVIDSIESIKKSPHDLVEISKLQKNQEGLIKSFEKFAKDHVEIIKEISKGKIKTPLRKFFSFKKGVGIIITTNIITMFLNKEKSFWEKAEYLGENTAQFTARVTPGLDLWIDAKEAWTGRDFFAEEVNPKTGKVEKRKLSTIERGLSMAFVLIDLFFNITKIAGLLTGGSGSALAQGGEMATKGFLRGMTRKIVKGEIKNVFKKEVIKEGTERVAKGYLKEAADIWTLGIPKLIKGTLKKEKLIADLVAKGVPKSEAKLAVKIALSSGEDVIKVLAKNVQSKARKEFLKKYSKLGAKGYEKLAKVVKAKTGGGILKIVKA